MQRDAQFAAGRDQRRVTHRGRRLRQEPIATYSTFEGSFAPVARAIPARAFALRSRAPTPHLSGRQLPAAAQLASGAARVASKIVILIPRMREAPRAAKTMIPARQ